MSGEVVIACRELSKRFGDHVVLDRLDLEIHRGETLVILGHSGTGKSVLLKHMNGLLTPDSGSVTFEGTDLMQLRETEMIAVRRRVGMLFQGSAMFDSLTVEDNVAFALDEHDICSGAERDERVVKLLDMVGRAGTQKKMPRMTAPDNPRNTCARRVIRMSTSGVPSPDAVARPGLPSRDGL